MPSDSESPLTEHLNQFGEGPEHSEYWKSVYANLHGLAHRKLRGQQPDGSLRTTMLVNEALVRVYGGNSPDFENRRHFFFTASRAMRSILVDRVRARSREKRTPLGSRIALDELVQSYEKHALDLDALDVALNELAERDARMAKLVELRFFGGCSMEETARLLDMSLRTAEREWQAARAWLRHKIS